MAEARNDARLPDRNATDSSAPDERQRAAADASPDDAELTEEIRRRAYQRYVTRGDAPGTAFDDWFDAEREVRAMRTGDGRADDARQEEPRDDESREDESRRAADTRAAAETRASADQASARGRRPRGQSAGDTRGEMRGESIGDQRADPA
jgi:hypothetical protein